MAAPCSTVPPAASRSLYPGTRQSRARTGEGARRKADGTSLTVVLPPAEGYGIRDESLIQRVPKRTLQGAGAINKGMQFQARTEHGMRLFTVTAVVGDMVTLDGNHPLADRTLHFDVQIVGVREATAEELEHGHVHGAGGHHH